MDRGLVPEFKQWNVTEREVEADWSEADNEGISLRYQVIASTSTEYPDALDKALSRKDHRYQLSPAGHVLKFTPYKREKACNRVVWVGWRHTFEGILRHQIPGVTRESIAAKFGVDMYKYPVGAPEDLVAALVEE
jgi:hypothetical protein